MKEIKTFVIKTQGCKSNQLESAVIREKLLKEGYKEVKNIDLANIYILNSCSVTENADSNALRIIRNTKNKNPRLLTILTGCSAQLNSENIKDLDYIDIVLGNDDKFEIIDAINEKQSKITDIFDIEVFNNQFVHDYSNTRGYLKVQDGCNNYCSYCTIPFARGNSRSNTIKNIIEQINIYTNNGIKEVVLTGIHIGQWGTDLDNSMKFINLLEEIEKTDIERYRLGSLNTLEIDNELLAFLSQSEKFCPHFHLSLQSLTNKTLANMNRKYTAESCIELIDKIYETFNKPFIGSDIIVGFPQESESDFTTTINNVKKSKLSNIHVFPYSVRKNTVAASMSGQIRTCIKQNRASILQEIANEKYTEFKKSNLNTITDILVEKRPDKKTNLLKGVTPNYLNVLIENSQNKDLYNTIAKIEIINIKDDMLIGKLV